MLSLENIKSESHCCLKQRTKQRKRSGNKIIYLRNINASSVLNTTLC